MAVLVLNPGSTTLKAAVVLADGSVRSHQSRETWDLGQAAREILGLLDSDVTAIGCRVVHGGQYFTEPTRVTPEVIDRIRELGDLAPLHNYGAAAVLRTCAELAPSLPVVAVFDTAYHTTLPPMARTYGIPYQLAETEGLYRYGFQGTVHQANVTAVALALEKDQRPNRRIISVHLGGGCSLCAALDGRSMDTTMGVTPLEGVMMATRSGDIDPGMLFHLMRKGWTPERVEKMLNQESGLRGVSGVSDDPRALFAAADTGNARAALAIDLYCYRIAKSIAAYTVPLGGVDGIAFSGGIGQHSGRIRQQVCDQLTHLGVGLDHQINGATDNPITPTGLHRSESSVGVYAVPANEEVIIAKITDGLLHTGSQ
ncbi:acetate/propionate family kinase [Patescibacteria group bacterium]|nr:acetate/propionate family kinase [Patescibacteria group bacterium]